MIMHYHSMAIMIVLTLVSQASLSQIGGISASKINSFNHAPIPKGFAEFEPNVTYSFSGRAWDSSGTLRDRYQSSDSVQVNGGISFRMAYTLSDHYEVGSIIAADYSSWSIKRALMTRDKLGLGVMAGINMPYGITTINRGQMSAEQITSYGVGAIGSYQMTEDASVDINLQYQDYFATAEDLATSDIYLSVDFGQYINQQQIYIIGSFLYQHSSFQGFNQNKLTLSPGISLEMKKSYLIVINANLDVKGRGSDKTHGFNVAWTMTL